MTSSVNSQQISKHYSKCKQFTTVTQGSWQTAKKVDWLHVTDENDYYYLVSFRVIYNK